jgi:hypothetical protein
MIEEHVPICIIQAAALNEIKLCDCYFGEYAAFLASDPARPFAASDLSSQNFDQDRTGLSGATRRQTGAGY